MIHSKPVRNLSRTTEKYRTNSCRPRISGTVRKISCVLLFFIVQFFSKASAQETNYAVHANIIYHFTKYIDWPPNKKSGDFIIGIVGDSPLYDELKSSIAGKSVGRQKIVIRQFSSSASSFACHILFVSVEESSRLKKIAASTADNPMLIVSEGSGLAGKGSCINFKVVQERLKLEINKNNIEKRGLSIATELLKLGTIVN